MQVFSLAFETNHNGKLPRKQPLFSNSSLHRALTSLQPEHASLEGHVKCFDVQGPPSGNLFFLLELYHFCQKLIQFLIYSISWKSLMIIEQHPFFFFFFRLCGTLKCSALLNWQLFINAYDSLPLDYLFLIILQCNSEN